MTKTEEKVYREIVKYLVEQEGFEEDIITPHSSAVDDLGMDSMSITEYLLFLEQMIDDETGTTRNNIPDDDAKGWKCIKDAVEYVVSKIDAKASTEEASIATE